MPRKSKKRYPDFYLSHKMMNLITKDNKTVAYWNHKQHYINQRRQFNIIYAVLGREFVLNEVDIINFN